MRAASTDPATRFARGRMRRSRASVPRDRRSGFPGARFLQQPHRRAMRRQPVRPGLARIAPAQMLDADPFQRLAPCASIECAPQTQDFEYGHKSACSFDGLFAFDREREQRIRIGAGAPHE
jgi:hypothetical protein